MKRILILLMAALSSACLRCPESAGPSGLAGGVSLVTASLVKTPMEVISKSVCTDTVEELAEAYLFAFFTSGESIIAATHINGTGECQWKLPRGENLEIWVLANPAGNPLKQTLRSMMSAGTLTRQDLLDLPPFVCPTTASLRELEENGSGLPMSAIVHVRFDEERETLTIPLKRLFAKYRLRLNFSRFLDEGWSVRAAGVKCMNCNGQVPYFYDGPGAGYAARTSSLVPVLDRDGGSDLVLLNDGESRLQAFFYLPENCQGDILTEEGIPAQSWKTVHQELGARVADCSYLSVNLTASKGDSPERRFSYRIYPGDEPEMNRNFDIVRNSYRSLTVTLTPGMETDAFRWISAQTLTVAPGGTVDIPYESSLENPCFTALGEGLEWVGSPGAGTARYRAADDASPSTVYALGGSGDFEVSDRVPVQISRRYPLRGTLPSVGVYFTPFRLSVTSNTDEWPDDVNPSSLKVISTATSGAEAIEILSGPHSDGGGWYFTACCTGPRSAADPSESLEIRDGGNRTLGVVEIPDVRNAFTAPSVFFDGPAMTADGCFVIPVDGADGARVNLDFETEYGDAVTVPPRYLRLASSDPTVDDLYAEYDSDGLDVYLPCWEGIPGLQEFDQSELSDAPYLQRISHVLQYRSKSGYAFHEESITFLIPNPFSGMDAVPPCAKVVSGRKVDIPSGWTLGTNGVKMMEWHIPKDRIRPAVSVSPVLLSGQGYWDAGTTYSAAPVDAHGNLLPYDIVQIPCDNRTYGQIGFRVSVENVRSGESASAWAAVVDIVRELEISATFRIHQRHYPLLSPDDEEARIRVSPAFDRSTALDPFVGMDFLKMSATAATQVHPTKAEAESLGSYWVNYAASLGTHHFFSAGTRYILPEDGGLRYEIQWNPGPTAGFFNYRVISLWNPPQYDFDLEGFRQKHPDAFPQMRLVPASGGMCRYLELEPYTRIVFYWERWRSAEWTDCGKGWYLCDNVDITPRYASAYYTPLSTIDPMYGRCFYGNPSQTGTDVDPVYGGDPFFIQSACNTFETILDY